MLSLRNTFLVVAGVATLLLPEASLFAQTYYGGYNYTQGTSVGEINVPQPYTSTQYPYQYQYQQPVYQSQLTGVRVEVTDNADTVEVGEDIHYVITLTNTTATPLQGLTVTSSLVGGVADIEPSHGGFHSGNQIVWNNVVLPANSSGQLFVDAVAAERTRSNRYNDYRTSSSIRHTVRINGGPNASDSTTVLGGGYTANNPNIYRGRRTIYDVNHSNFVGYRPPNRSVNRYANVNELYELDISITDNQSTARFGDELEYTIDIRNHNTTRTATIQNVQVQVDLSDNLIFDSATRTGSVRGKRVTFYNVTVPVGGTSFTMKARIGSQGGYRVDRNAATSVWASAQILNGDSKDTDRTRIGYYSDADKHDYIVYDYDDEYIEGIYLRTEDNFDPYDPICRNDLVYTIYLENRTSQDAYINAYATLHDDMTFKYADHGGEKISDNNNYRYDGDNIVHWDDIFVRANDIVEVELHVRINSRARYGTSVDLSVRAAGRTDRETTKIAGNGLCGRY